MEKMNKKQDIPGTEMKVYKVISPDNIILKLIDYDCAKLTERMNEVYSVYANKNDQKLTWNISDLCAAYIEKYGNWYRGKIMNMDDKEQTVSIYFYDLDVTLNDICVNTLCILEKTLVEEKCGMVHCAMDKLNPLDVSDKKWPQYSCDRLIQELKKYPTVYFAQKGNKNIKGEVKLSGEIWIKKITKPHALKPLQIHWINLNKLIIEQGVVVNDNKNTKGGELSTIESATKTEFHNSFENLKNSKLIHSWLPPILITESQFNAVVTYVDMQCCIYLQQPNSVILLNKMTEQLNSIFKDSNPEPINYKWTKGQMVTVKYHQNNLWYRGTIINIDINGEITVQFLDYGNVEKCSHEELRSALYMTDVPQMCFKGFFSSILPMTKSGQWKITTLDLIHYLIVDNLCTVWINSTKSSTDSYAIKKLRNDFCNDICQYLVTCHHAYFDYIDPSNLNLLDDKNQSDADECFDENSIRSQTSNKNIFLTKKCDSNDHIKDGKSSVQSVTRVVDVKVMNKDKRTVHAKFNGNTDDSENTTINIANYFGNKDPSGYFHFLLKNIVVEGTLGDVVEPTKIVLIVEKINGVSIKFLKEEMNENLLKKCVKLPILDKIIPGTAVVVLHNILWRRGTIINDKFVFLVDLGLSITLVKKNLKLLPSEFFKIPMLSINCQLANVFKSEQADAKQVKRKISKLLKGVTLKIVEVNNKNDIKSDIVDVELYNDKNEIAYQPLINDQSLISINHA